MSSCPRHVAEECEVFPSPCSSPWSSSRGEALPTRNTRLTSCVKLVLIYKSSIWVSRTILASGGASKRRETAEETSPQHFNTPPGLPSPPGTSPPCFHELQNTGISSQPHTPPPAQSRLQGKNLSGTTARAASKCRGADSISGAGSFSIWLLQLRHRHCSKDELIAISG